MSGSRSGFAVTISARDSASNTFDAINKRIATLQRQAEKFGRESGRLGETSGVNRLAQGMKLFGGHTTDAWRSLDRLLPLLGILTGATTLAGMTLLTRKWAELGQSTANLSYRLATPVERIGAIRGALQQVGGTAEEADAGLRGFQSTLSSAQWGRSAEAMQAFNELGVAVGDARLGQGRQMTDVLGDVAEKLDGKTADAQSRALERLGLGGDAWLKALGHGRKAWEDLQKASAATGGTMTEEMTKNAERMQRSWSLLEQAVTGVRNRLIDEYAPAVSGILERTEKWIERNKDTADSIGEIATAATLAITGLAGLKMLPWIARLLGLPYSMLPLLHGDTTDPDMGPKGENPNWEKMSEPEREDARRRYNQRPGVIGGWWQRQQARRKMLERQPDDYSWTIPQPTVTPTESPGRPDRMPVGPTFGPQRPPILDYRGNQYNPATQEWSPVPDVRPDMPAPAPGGLLDVRPNVPAQQGAASRDGRVTVDVNLKGPPTASVETSGPVRAPPPRIEMPQLALA